MRQKRCIVCKDIFTYKNKSKKYCSNRCKQQALRNRKIEIARKVDNGLGSNYDELVSSLMLQLKNRIVALSNESSPVHISELKFLKGVILSIKDSELSVEILVIELKTIKQIIKHLYHITEKYQDEYGCMIFRKHTVKKVLKTLKQMNKH